VKGCKSSLAEKRSAQEDMNALIMLFGVNHIEWTRPSFDFDEQGVEEEVQVGDSEKGGIYTRRRRAQKTSSPASSIRHNHDRLHLKKKNAQEDMRVSDVPFGQITCLKTCSFLLFREEMVDDERQKSSEGRTYLYTERERRAGHDHPMYHLLDSEVPKYSRLTHM
jgi:hypothetical protein